MFGVNPDKVLTDKGTEHDLNVMVHFANQLNGIKHKVHCVQNDVELTHNNNFCESKTFRPQRSSSVTKLS